MYFSLLYLKIYKIIGKNFGSTMQHNKKLYNLCIENIIKFIYDLTKWNLTRVKPMNRSHRHFST